MKTNHKIHLTRGLYQVSRDGAWFPGAFASRQAAKLSLRLSYEQLVRLRDGSPQLAMTAAQVRKIIEQKRPSLRHALTDLFNAVTSKHAMDTQFPIAWSGSPAQNRAMNEAIEQARAALGK